MIGFRQGVEIVETEEGRVVLDAHRGMYWHLNDSAISLLEALGRGRPFDDIVRETALAGDVEETRVRTDYLALLEELRREKLVEGRLP
ncbi:PqqD family peptide modification chaperone [Streptomyces ossamyceticus]|nr:PqqD family peptide modification chaperone [Streptomyces ossamyceticus]